MKQATTRRDDAIRVLHISRRLKEGSFILLCSIAIYLFIALLTYHDADPAWSHIGMSEDIQNAAGKTGAWLADVLFSLFGYMAYIFPVALIFAGSFVYRDVPLTLRANPIIWAVRGLGLFIALIASCGLTSTYYAPLQPDLPMSSGGLLGVMIQSSTVSYLNNIGASVILVALFLAGITLFTGFSWLSLIHQVGSWGIDKVHTWRQRKGSLRWPTTVWPAIQKMVPTLAFLQPKESKAMKVRANEENGDREEKLPFLKPLKAFKKNSLPALKKIAAKTPFSSLDEIDEDHAINEVNEEKIFDKALKTKCVQSKENEKKTTVPLIPVTPIPSLSLLENTQKAHRLGYSAQQLQELSRLVETRLLEFGVDAKVVGVFPGPVITRFELDLAAGIKVNKITGLAKDLARSLSVVSVRVVEVIPGKPVVGLEIPNTHRELVKLKEVLEDASYQQAASCLSLALGKDISGRSVIVDLAKMPHLLVAGTTGSGKSVGLNAMLLSILYKSTPEQTRLILIDPKMLELAVYDNIPHLLTPVVTDMKDAANALRWCVAEMERRYQIMAAIGVRNLLGYNQKVEGAAQSGKPIVDPLWQPRMAEKPQALEKLPFIVVVVDEFADMIMVVGKKVEELIARIAQKARAAGIHLILATQRPSVDVITGLIKANIPTRIAFQVSSRIDSRTILDQSGAEQLLGHGDMLYLPPGVGIPHRIHGAFVSDDEVHKVTAELRKSGNPTYIESVLQSSANLPAGQLEDEELDELYDQAVFVVTQEKKASISLVQRRLKIGYNRAARLVERMEAEGVVSSVQSNGTREVLAPPPVE